MHGAAIRVQEQEKWNFYQKFTELRNINALPIFTKFAKSDRKYMGAAVFDFNDWLFNI